MAYSIKDVERTAARAVLMRASLVSTSKSLMYCGFDNVSGALARVAKVMIRAGLYPDYDKPIAQTARNGSILGARR